MVSNNFQFTSENEKIILGFLKDGAREHSDIIKGVKDAEGKKLTESTANRILKELAENGRIFRIEKGKRVFYRLNDFPIDIGLFLTFLDAIPNEMDMPELLKSFFQGLKLDIITLWSKLTFDQILDMKLIELETLRKAQSSKEVDFWLKMFQQFKERL
jgi:hypothetical protein